MMWFLCLLNVVLLFVWFYRDRKRKQSLFKTMGVNGPEPNVIFGNIHQIGNRKLCEAIQDWTCEYGKTYGYYEGPTPILVTSDLDILKQVYVKQFNNFYGRKWLPIQPDPDSGNSRDVHMFLSTGDRWKHLRTVTNPSFSSAKMKQLSPVINKYVDEMVESLDEKHQEGKPFDMYRMMQALTLDVIAECAFGMEVNSQKDQDDPFLKRCRALFSEDTHRLWLLMLGLIFPEFRPGWWRVHKFLGYFREDMMEWLFNNLGKVIEMRQNVQWKRVDLLQLLLDAESSAASRRSSASNLTMTEQDKSDTNNNSNNNVKESTETRKNSENTVTSTTENVDSFAAKLTKRLLNLQSKSNGNSSTQHTSGSSATSVNSASANSMEKQEVHEIKQQNKGLSMDEVKAQSVLFLLAGYETTSTLLAYITYELACNPHIQEKLQAEIDSHYQLTSKVGYEQVVRMPYLNMVIREVLRMYPLAELVQGRRCMNTCDVEGLTIPVGTTIQPDIWSIHYNPEFWGPTDTKVFEPERHTTEKNAARHPMAFMAFGAGPKNCVGMRFALMETKIALVKILHKFRFCKCEETQVPLTFVEGGTLTPKHGVVIKLEKRKDVCDTIASPATSDYHSDLSEVFEE